MDISSQEIEAIVRQVLAGMGPAASGVAPVRTAAPVPSAAAARGDRGVFEDVDSAVQAAWEAQRDWASHFKLEDRQRVVEAIRRCARSHVEEWSRKIVEETGMGQYEDKVEKHLATINKTPGPECLTTDAISGDTGLMLEEYAPFGVICSITPTTNPTETIINNTISMISGGMGMVNALLRSGKKCIGAGAGNPPVIVDETADIELAGRKIYEGASFDNNILCFAEKEVFAVGSAYAGLVHQLEKQGAYLLNPAQTEQLVKLALQPDSKEGWSANKKWVGQNASKILAAIGVQVPDTCRLAVCQVPAVHPFVLAEQMMPILPVVCSASFEEAVEQAVAAEHGNRHTASIFSKDVDHMTRFARAIETTIYVKNSATKAGVGIGGEGHCTMTIAGPTGEGITCARSFCRRRRCVLAEGGLRII